MPTSSAMQAPKKAAARAKAASQPPLKKAAPAKPVPVKKATPTKPAPSPSAPPQTPRRAASKAPCQPSPPKPATPKAKPAFKVPAKVTEPKLGTPPGSVRKRNAVDKSTALLAPTCFAESTALLAPSCFADDTDDEEEAIYPRPMARADALSHPALAFAGLKLKPANYPRPPEIVHPAHPYPEPLSAVIVDPSCDAEAFAAPPCSPAADGARFASAPQ
ncbi:hypothetical protein C0993_003382, partial [Termitomyces sp. T159_Od127]